MAIRFIGNQFEFIKTKKLLKDHIDVDINVPNPEAIIFEISSIDMLYKIPKRPFNVPVFFYVTKNDKNIIANIKGYTINGIFFPPLKPEAILEKLGKVKSVAETNTQNISQDFDTLRIKIVAKAENIPALPSIAQDLISLTNGNSNANISEISNKIKMDQGISSKVVKLVNSPFYGVRQNIDSIDRATALLGFNSVKNIALAISINSYFQKPFSMFKTTGEKFWQHSYNVALISQAIAKELNENQDALYMAGLMHDIGKVVMVDFLVKEVDSIKEEREQLGLDHTEIANTILTKWSIMPDIVAGVKTHHSPSPSKYGFIISVANSIDHNINKLDTYIDLLNNNYPLKNKEALSNTITLIIKGNNE